MSGYGTRSAISGMNKTRNNKTKNNTGFKPVPTGNVTQLYKNFQPSANYVHVKNPVANPTSRVIDETQESIFNKLYGTLTAPFKGGRKRKTHRRRSHKRKTHRRRH
jgi:hypothetical protein